MLLDILALNWPWFHRGKHKSYYCHRQTKNSLLFTVKQNITSTWNFSSDSHIRVLLKYFSPVNLSFNLSIKLCALYQMRSYHYCEHRHFPLILFGSHLPLHSFTTSAARSHAVRLQSAVFFSSLLLSSPQHPTTPAESFSTA